MMKKTILFLMMLACLSLASVTFTVQSEKGLYNPGDDVLVHAYLVNKDDSTFSGIIYSTLVTEARGEEAIIPKEVYLGPLEKKSFTLYEFKVTDQYRPGEYTVTSNLVSNGSLAGYSEDYFMINGTPMDMDVRVYSCTDSTCSNETALFLSGQSAYIMFNSTESDVQCSAKLTSPTGSTASLTLPATATLSEKGTYKLTATCTKQGFNQRTPSLTLSVLDAWPTVQTIQRCNENGVCDNNEDHSICPQDCPEPEEAAAAFPIEYIIGAVAVIVAALLVGKFVLSKKQ